MFGEREVGEDIQLSDGERGIAALGRPADCECCGLGLREVGERALRAAVERERDGRRNAFDADGRGILRRFAEEEDVHLSAGLGIGEEREAREGLRTVEAEHETGLGGGGLHVEKRLRIVVNGALPRGIAAARVGESDRAFCIDASHVECGLVIHEVTEKLLGVCRLRALADGHRGCLAFAEDIDAVDRRGVGDVRLDEDVFRELVDAVRELVVVDALDGHVLRDLRPGLVARGGVGVARVDRDGAARDLCGEFEVREHLRLGEADEVVLLALERRPAGGDVVVEPRSSSLGVHVALCGGIEER